MVSHDFKVVHSINQPTSLFIGGCPSDHFWRGPLKKLGLTSHVNPGFINPWLTFIGGCPIPFSGDSDHFWRDHPPNTGTGVLILGQHDFICAVDSLQDVRSTVRDSGNPRFIINPWLINRGVSPFSGDSDHFWREHPLKLFLLGQQPYRKRPNSFGQAAWSLEAPSMPCCGAAAARCWRRLDRGAGARFGPVRDAFCSMGKHGFLQPKGQQAWKHHYLFVP